MPLDQALQPPSPSPPDSAIVSHARFPLAQFHSSPYCGPKGCPLLLQSLTFLHPFPSLPQIEISLGPPQRQLSVGTETTVTVSADTLTVERFCIDFLTSTNFIIICFAEFLCGVGHVMSGQGCAGVADGRCRVTQLTRPPRPLLPRNSQLHNQRSTVRLLSALPSPYLTHPLPFSTLPVSVTPLAPGPFAIRGLLDPKAVAYSGGHPYHTKPVLAIFCPSFCLLRAVLCLFLVSFFWRSTQKPIPTTFRPLGHLCRRNVGGVHRNFH